MSKITFIEDIFVKFYNHNDIFSIGVQHQDISPMESFYQKLSTNQTITQAQGNYILKILEKYKKIAALTGFDYEDHLKDAIWKNQFRILDLAKKIYVEKREDGKLEICLKFPFQLKQEFDKEIDVNLPGSNKTSHWDQENKVRRLDFYDFNLIKLYEFALKHSFEIDETFMCAMADVEEIWQNEENIKPICYINHDTLLYKNTSESVDEYIQTLGTLSQTEQLLTMKSLGVTYVGPCTTVAHKIASSANNTFWMKTNDDFFKMYKVISGKVAIILDRTANTLEWLKKFVVDAEQWQINRDEIRVCFRDSKEQDTGLNDWIKLAGVGGKIDDGRIFIFEHKPAKWLFKDKHDVKIIITNNLYPHTSQITKDWLDSHPCVIYLGDIKPSEQRGKKIVEL
jgi:hypothetical protein